MLIALTVALAVVVGVALGLLGGGGSILMVPLLVYVAGIEAKEAIAASLVVVGVTAAVSVIGHARAGRVRWRTGLIFGAAGMAGALVGGFIGGHLPGQLLMIAFAGDDGRHRRGHAPRPAQDVDPAKAHAELPVGRVLLDGAVVGLVTGLVGAGGGFLVVPALALLGGLPMGVAVGTSLLVIAMKSFAGLAGYLATVSIDWAPRRRDHRRRRRRQPARRPARRPHPGRRPAAGPSAGSSWPWARSSSSSRRRRARGSRR